MASVNTTSYLGRSIGVLGAGITADNTALFGLFGQLQNLNAMVSEGIASISTGTGTAATVPATAFSYGCWDLAAGASGGFTLTLPTTAQIIAALPPTIPSDGQFLFDIDIINDAVGQTATITAGDASTTLLGNMTVANNTCRTVLFQVNVKAKTINVMNKGTKNL